MSVDLERQVREYAEFLREAAGVVEPDVVVGRATLSTRKRPSGWRRPLLVAVAAAVGVLVLVGGVASLRKPSEPDAPVATQQPAPTTTVPQVGGIESVAPPKDPPTVTAEPSGEQVTTVLSIPGRIAAPHVGVGPDGHPVVLYAEIGEGQQEAREHWVARCTDPACAGDTETYPIPVDAGGGIYAIWAAVLPDGAPVITRRVGVVPETPERSGVFRDDLVVCDDPDCTSPTITTLDGAASGIAVGHDGLPVLLLHFPGEGNDPTPIVVRRCRDRQCSTFDDVMLGERWGYGRSTFLTVAPDGVPIAVYGRGGPPSAGHGAVLLTCRDPECTGAPVAVAMLEQFSGKAVPGFDASGLPVVLFVDESESDTRMVSCLDRVCSDYTTIEMGIGPAPWITSAIGFGGKLLLAWVSPHGTLNVAHCDGSLCEAASVDTGMLPAGARPSPNVNLSIAVPDDGLPVLVYGIQAPSEPPAGIALTKCGDPYCRP